MKYYFLPLIFLLLFINSCKKEVNKTLNSQKKDSTEKVSPPNVIKFHNKTFSVPSPIMVSKVIKNKDIPFYIEKLNPTENRTKYLTSFKQALNLGVYGADLAYILLYDQLGTSGEYFATIKEMSEKLGVMNSLQEKTLERIEKNNENKDSLIAISSTIYRDIDHYLITNDQRNISVYIITGGWIESIYLLSNIIEDYPQEEFIQKLAEQKYPLNNILELLKPFYNNKNPGVDSLIDRLIAISMIYDGIEENYSYKGKKVYPDKKLTVVNSITHYNITDRQTQEIKKKITELRQWITN